MTMEDWDWLALLANSALRKLFFQTVLIIDKPYR